MFETISIVVVTLRQQRTVQTVPTLERFLPLLAISNDALPLGWAQNWAHEFSDATNHSGKSTLRAPSSLPWAQGVAGSNPVAPTTFPICRSRIGHKRRRPLRSFRGCSNCVRATPAPSITRSQSSLNGAARASTSMPGSALAAAGSRMISSFEKC